MNYYYFIIFFSSWVYSGEYAKITIKTVEQWVPASDAAAASPAFSVEDIATMSFFVHYQDASLRNDIVAAFSKTLQRTHRYHQVLKMGRGIVKNKPFLRALNKHEPLGTGIKRFVRDVQHYKKSNQTE